MANEREQWQSSWGFVLATVGSAIGLGNIWRFPTVVGRSGGGAFLILYLLIIIVIGLPLMLAELAIGRRGSTNIIHSFQKIKPDSYWWLIGGLGVTTGFVILSFYSVISGWSMNYIYRFFAGDFAGLNPEQIEEVYEGFVGNPVAPVFWQGLFVAIVIGVVIMGITKGIEKVSKILMPVMFVLLFLLLFRSVTLEGAREGIMWYLKPDFSVINLGIVLSALGQVFFSLSLGMGSVITYGSYLTDEQNIPRSGLVISVADLTIAIVSGLIIIPSVFAFGLEPEIGPPLIFVTLPLVFGSIPFGNIFGGLFFTLLSIAALTSAIAILEVVVSYFMDELDWGRKKVAIITGITIFILGLPSSLSMGVLKDFLIWDLPFLDFMDFLSANLLLPLTGLLTVIFVGWVWKPEGTLKEIRREGVNFRLWKPWAVIIKYVLPVVLSYVLITGLI